MNSQRIQENSLSCAVGFIKVIQDDKYLNTRTYNQAWAQIRNTVGSINVVIKKCKGTVIKLIGGDTVMFTFLTADMALKATVEIQEKFSSRESTLKKLIEIKIGFSYGEMLVEGNDVFGQIVAVASRIANIAKAGQILTDKNTVLKLPMDARKYTRLIDHFPAKGISEPIDVFEVIRDMDDITKLGSDVLDKEQLSQRLKLIYLDDEYFLSDSNKLISIGRGKNTTIHVDDPNVSRIHAKIEYLRGKFVLTDQSINGTFLSTTHGKLRLRHDESQLLYGSGSISVGKDFDDGGSVIFYEVSV